MTPIIVATLKILISLIDFVVVNVYKHKYL